MAALHAQRPARPLPGAIQRCPPARYAHRPLIDGREMVKPTPLAALHPRTGSPPSAYTRVETQPGLDAFAGNTAGMMQEALGPLLDWARRGMMHSRLHVDAPTVCAVVPKDAWPGTPVLCLGTGGLRALSNEQRWSVLAAVREILLHNAQEGGFRCASRLVLDVFISLCVPCIVWAMGNGTGAFIGAHFIGTPFTLLMPGLSPAGQGC